MQLQFQYAEYAWLFGLLLPVAAAWLWWNRRKKAIVAGLATHPRLLNSLLVHYRPRVQAFHFISFLFSLVCLVVAVMNPRRVSERAGMPMEGSQVMLAIDVSNSMLAADVAPNRLEKARTFAIRLTEALGGNRIGVLAFAGEARLQMPPTADMGAVKQAIQTLSARSIPIQGTNIEAALDVARQSLSADALAYSAVVLVSDGEALEGAALQKAAYYGKQGMMVFVAGLGTEEGALLSEPESGQPILDENDRQVLSKFNPGLLAELAERAGGKFVQVTDIADAIQKITGALGAVKQTSMANAGLVNYYSFAPWLVALALVLLVFPLLPWPRFAAGLASAPKAIALHALLIIASPYNGLGQNAVKLLSQGLEAYRAGNYRQAGDFYSAALDREPSGVEARFYLGLVAFKLGQYQEAARRFTELAASAPAGGILQAAQNNAGLSFAKAGRLPEAIQAFRQALQNDPSDREIIQNLQKAILDMKAQQEKNKPDPQKPEPPMDKEDAERKLRSLMDEERRTREKMKPRPLGNGNEKNW